MVSICAVEQSRWRLGCAPPSGAVVQFSALTSACEPYLNTYWCMHMVNRGHSEGE